MTEKKPNSKPKTIEQINRKANVLMLIGDDYGAVTRFARAYGVSQAYLWQIRNTDRGVGEVTARKIERFMSLEPGWMDRDHSEKEKKVDLFASQLFGEASQREVPIDMRATILNLLKSAPLKR